MVSNLETARSMESITLGGAISLLAKGDPGCGKTVGTASFERAGDMYVFDVDQRITPVKRFYGDKWRGKFNQFTSYRQIAEKLDGLISYNPYATISFESLTSLSRMLMNFMRYTRAKSTDDSKGTKRVQALAAGGIITTEIEDYSGEANGINQVIDALRVLFKQGKGANIILSAHVLEVSSTDLKGITTTKRYLVNAGGKRIVAEVPSYFDEAWHFDSQSVATERGLEAHYYIWTKSVGDDWAKTALPLDSKIDFTNKRLYDLVMEQVNARKDQPPVMGEL